MVEEIRRTGSGKGGQKECTVVGIVMKAEREVVQ
jgi:hypothetical protein